MLRHTLVRHVFCNHGLSRRDSCPTYPAVCHPHGRIRTAHLSRRDRCALTVDLSRRDRPTMLHRIHQSRRRGSQRARSTTYAVRASDDEPGKKASCFDAERAPAPPRRTCKAMVGGDRARKHDDPVTERPSACDLRGRVKEGTRRRFGRRSGASSPRSASATLTRR